jgi:hypothetical protein
MRWLGVARRAAVVAFAGGLIGIAPVAGIATASAAGGAIGYTGRGFGTSVNVAGTVVSGPSAAVYMGCSTNANQFHENDVASVDVAGMLDVGAVTDTTSSARNSATTTSEIGAVNLAAGTVTADAVTSSANVTFKSGGFTETGDSNIVNLVVNGTPVAANQPPNTQIAIPELGTLTINEQIQKSDATTASMTVRALHLKVTAPSNPAGLAVGTNIIVASSSAGLVQSPGGLLDGHAFGSRVSTDSGVESGRTAHLVMPCEGTDGTTRTNSTVGVSLAGQLTTGTVSSTVEGVVDSDSASGEVTNSVQNVNVAGVVTADVVKADVLADNSSATPFTDASTFSNLAVAGMPLITDQVPANTSVAIPMVGTLYLHRVINNSSSIEVRMIELVVTSSVAPLPIGTDIVVGVAHISLH